MDFKTISIVEESLKMAAYKCKVSNKKIKPTLMFFKTKLFILKERVSFELWLNADILHGPINAKDPVPADNFMQLCKKYFPDCLNLRWVSSTHFLAVFPIHLHFNLVSSLLSRMAAQKIHQLLGYATFGSGICFLF